MRSVMGLAAFRRRECHNRLILTVGDEYSTIEMVVGTTLALQYHCFVSSGTLIHTEEPLDKQVTTLPTCTDFSRDDQKERQHIT
ncbi:hypothetical protein E5288_WYG014258 [Bos mutus]|uniref:Uncharacterized protein n=1 Tax=Bos mutus TaxID=72004 RepID=A0A6B0R8Y9_9CETA|nr:hypothetical protein [Bos mutus]